jgi:hypothetical protein
MFPPISEVDPIITEVFRQLQPYDPLDLLVTIAALQLCPENADHAIRLDALAFIAACLPYEGGKPQISRHRIDRICNSHPLGDGWLKFQEDPCDNPFTEAFTFFGGSYVVFPGIVENATFTLKHLLLAILQQSAFDNHRQLMDRVHNLSLAILVLSDQMATRSGLVRNMEPVSSRDVYIPPNLSALKQAVSFTSEDLENTLGSHRLSPDDLTPFIQEISDMELSVYSVENTPLYSKPIIHVGDSFIVSEPGILLASLRYQILLASKKAGVIGLLSREYREATANTVGKSLGLFGLRQVRGDFLGEFNRPFLRDGLWAYDTDKALYVATVTDDFSNFKGDKVFEINPQNDVGDLLDEYLANVEEVIFAETQNLNEILIMVVFAGVGRGNAVGLRLDTLKTDPNILSLTVEELEVLSFIYSDNPLILYQYARDLEGLRTKTQPVSFSTLDQFEAYRSNDFSFYMSDDARPSTIIFSPGDGKALRLEALRKHDRHAVPYWKPRSFVEVYNLYNSQEIPIYAPLMTESKGEWYVELDPVPFWVVVDSNLDESETPSAMPRAIDFVDMITYWLWQFSEELRNCLGGITLSHPPAIVVGVDKRENWKENDSKLLLEQYPLPVTCNLDPDGIQVRASFHPSVLPALYGSDNKGELMCMDAILHSIADLLERIGDKSAARNLVGVTSIIHSKHSSNPFKKKVLILRPGNSPQLAPGNPHRYRKVQGSERNVVLDELGQYLSNNVKLPEGQIPNEQVVEVLNKSVAFYFDKLEKTVCTFSPDRLLDFLVGKYEALVTEKASRKLTVPTRIACFQNSGDLVKDLVSEERELNDAAISCRFLIEYVVSRPPKGMRPISITAFDRMMALASEIISRGQESDFSQYGLFDVRLSMLRSGRLGFDNQKSFGAIGDSFMGSRSREETDEAIRNFEFWWRPEPDRNPEIMPQPVRDFNAAYMDEFGISLTELSTFVSTLGNIGVDFGNGSQLIKYDKNELKAKIAALTGWSDHKFEQFLDFLSLKPRQRFLEVPAGFQRADVYPWRMNRELSYMRRPLLIVTRGDQVSVCWGVRHLFDAFSYIAYGSIGGRLKPSYASSLMQKWLGKKHNQDGKEFTDQVRRASSNIPGALVRSEVKKFGPVRLGYPGDDLGDIDVILVLPEKKFILLVECKNLVIARTPIEMKRELEELFVDIERASSAVTKVVRRQQWIQRNLDIVLSYFKLELGGRWKIDSLLVTSDELLTPYFYRPSIDVVSYLRFIEDYLPHIGKRIRRIKN